MSKSLNIEEFQPPVPYEVFQMQEWRKRETLPLRIPCLLHLVRLKEKESYADIMRRHGLDPKLYSSLRYKKAQILRGIYWWYFARVVRIEDTLEYGTCVSCGRPFTFDEVQAGHFVPAGKGGFTLLFNRKNVNAECEGCNGFDEMHLLGYEKNLDKRYGPGTAAELIRLKNQSSMKEWSKLEYENIYIPQIREKYEAIKHKV